MTRTDRTCTSACVRLRCHPCVPVAGPSTLMLMVPKARHHACGYLQQLQHGLMQARAARQAGICSQSSQHQHTEDCLRSRCRLFQINRIFILAAHSRAQQCSEEAAGHGWTALTRATWFADIWVAGCGQLTSLSKRVPLRSQTSRRILWCD